MDGVPEDLNYQLQMKDGIIQVYKTSADLREDRPHRLPYPDIETFAIDLSHVLAMIADGPTQVSGRRAVTAAPVPQADGGRGVSPQEDLLPQTAQLPGLQVLPARNAERDGGAEGAEERRPPGLLQRQKGADPHAPLDPPTPPPPPTLSRSSPQVDTHIHAAACMNQKHLLKFIKTTYQTEAERQVLEKGGQRVTLKQVFSSLNMDPYDLTVDSLDVHAVATPLHMHRKHVIPGFM